MYYKNRLIPLLMLCGFLASCLPSHTYEKKYSMPSYGWVNNHLLSYQFTIKDTSSKYNLFFLLQHGYAYPYSNIWIKMYTTYPNGTKDTTPLEIPLAVSSGQWMGNSFSKIVAHKMNIGPNASALHFLQKGTYTIQVQQIMRLDTLQDISQCGLSIEQIEK